MRIIARPVCLTIAGSDSGGGAGIQADLKTFQAFGCFGTSVLTAVTAQNTQGVRDLAGVSVGLVESQLAAVLEDLPVVAAKTGMLFSAEIIVAVREAWTRHISTAAGKRIPLIIDPVMVATSGDRLLLPEAERALRDLLGLATLITPNIPEALVLLEDGDFGAGVVRPDQEDLARRLYDRFRTGVLVKGGHRAPQSGEAVDVLYAGGQVHSFRAPLLDARHTHGTGCTLSAAIVAGLAQGRDLVAAVAAAKEYVTGAIQHAPGLGSGNGPLDHMWAGG